MAKSARHRRFKPRRWPFFVFLALMVAAVAGLVYIAQPADKDVLPINDRPQETTSVQTTQSIDQPEQSIPASPVTQIFLPSEDSNLEINNGVLPLDNCRSGIVPPLDGEYIGAVFGCTDYEYPSTSSTSLSVLAGHSSCLVDTVFNRLNRQLESLVGREIWVKTQTSGDKWLVYQIESTFEPPKDELSSMEVIWGSPRVSTAGKLALITCLLGDCGGVSTNNLVVMSRFTGIR
ncbi:MAG: hypothetical protein QG549_671 [Patescibacteria group bacterium]|nr:hypothetical protein [Patescibacteria group bacterium]